jgi:hypothetical protein
MSRAKQAVIGIMSGMGSQVLLAVVNPTLPDYPAVFLTSFLARVLILNNFDR